MARIPRDRPGWYRRKPSFHEAVVTAHEAAAESVRRITLAAAPWLGGEPLPGQFLMLRVSTEQAPLLSRPFGVAGFVHRPPGAEVEIYYRLAGRGTGLMSRWSVGDRVRFTGPLGSGFPLPPTGERALLVAGGIGIPPLLFLARKLAAEGRAGETEVLYGGGRIRKMAAIEALADLGVRLALRTEDGSGGERGLATEGLEDRELSDRHLYACGPAPLLAALHRIAGRCRSAHFSLEARMACGFGVCSGCAVRVAPPPPPGWDSQKPFYQRVCREGPVFDAKVLLPESFG